MTDLPQPETVLVQTEVQEQTVHPLISDRVLQTARVGDVLPIGPDQEVPGNWLTCDGRTLDSQEYPEFVQYLRITLSTFTLPKPQRGDKKFIIKVASDD